MVTDLEHHSNFVPWQQLAERKSAIFKVIPVHEDGTLDFSNLDQYITKKTKIIAVSHVSNVLGVQNDVDVIVRAARAVGALVLVDAAQSIAHQSIDVKKMDTDFLVFSGHKMLGPTGIGCLYIRKEIADQLAPYQFGGGMVYQADITGTTFLRSPHKFEAGTPPIAEAIGLAAAVNYIKKMVHFEQLRTHEASLCARLIDGLSKHKKIRILGPHDQLRSQGHMVSFVAQDMHAHDVAAYLSNQGICVRAGHHCAQPLAKKLNIDASIRVSFYLYNTQEEVDRLIGLLKSIRHPFGHKMASFNTCLPPIA